MGKKTALERAVDKDHSSIVYYLVKEYNQDISNLDQVHTYIAMYIVTYLVDVSYVHMYNVYIRTW